MSICISIVSHNRADELKRTLKQVSRLNPAPDEVRITLDRCTDNSLEVIQENAPNAIVTSSDAGGSIPNRDAIIRATSCEWILSLDDDSYPIETDAIAKLSKFAFGLTQVGVITFNQISDEFADKPPQDLLDMRQIASFQNSGALIKKSAYEATRGYPHFFRHAYEEPDLCLQLLDQGYQSIISSGITIRHHYSNIERNEQRTHCFHARNEFLSTLMRCPAVLLVPSLLRVVVAQGRYALKRQWLLTEFKWWFAGLKAVPNAWRERKPVQAKTYRNWRRILHNPKPLTPSANIQ